MPHGVRSEPDCLKNGYNELYVTGDVLFEEWPKWKRCFKQYHLASRLSVASEERQVSTPLYCLSKDVLDTAIIT